MKPQHSSMLNSDMKLFISRIFTYSIVILGISLYVQYFIDTGLQKYKHEDYGIWNKIFQGKINADIIVQGSSRSLVQFDPAIIEQNTGLTCFNLGTSGGRFLMQKAKWDSYILYNKPPKILIQNVDIMVMRKEWFIFNKAQYLPFLDQPSIASNLEDIDNRIWFEKNIPLYKYRGFRHVVSKGLRSYFNLIPHTRDNYYNGFISVKKSWNHDFDSFKAKNNEVIHSKEDIRFGYSFLEKLMHECKERNIKLILVHAPLYSELLQIVPQKGMIDSLFNKLANKYGMVYWDYTNLPIYNSKNYFYNSTHLNSVGARIFSEQFSNDLNSYIEKNTDFKFTLIDKQYKKNDLGLPKRNNSEY